MIIKLIILIKIAIGEDFLTSMMDKYITPNV
jgi:hypothetical protein